MKPTRNNLLKPFFALLLVLISVIPVQAANYPILVYSSFEPATITVKVMLKNGTLWITNTGRQPLRRLRLFAQCADEPENFSTRLIQIAPGGVAKVSLAAFERAAGDGHGRQRLDGSSQGEIDDLLILCQNGSRSGRWYGMGQAKNTQINITNG